MFYIPAWVRWDFPFLYFGLGLSMRSHLIGCIRGWTGTAMTFFWCDLPAMVGLWLLWPQTTSGLWPFGLWGFQGQFSWGPNRMETKRSPWSPSTTTPSTWDHRWIAPAGILVERSRVSRKEIVRLDLCLFSSRVLFVSFHKLLFWEIIRMLFDIKSKYDSVSKVNFLASCNYHPEGTPDLAFWWKIPSHQHLKRQTRIVVYWRLCLHDQNSNWQ